MELIDGRIMVKGSPNASLSIADIGMKAYWFKLDLPTDMESGLEGTYTYDHPFASLPQDNRKDLGVFYPIMGHSARAIMARPM